VLERGLPDLPLQVNVGEAVPIAYWAGPKYGAVVCVVRYEPDMFTEDFHVDEDVHCFHRMTEGWTRFNADGGTNWPPGSDLSRLQYEADYANLSEQLSVSEDDLHCTAVSGVVGRDASWVEVSDVDGTQRQPVQAPLGVVVVCVRTDADVTIRILDQDDALLATRTVWRQRG
jgi:hypothetical protein